MTSESTGTQDLRTYLRIFWRWKLLFVAFLIVIPVAAYLTERSKSKVYAASTLIELQNGTISAAGAPVATGNLDAVARIVTTPRITRRAALLMDPPVAPGSIAGEASASADQTTGFLTITVQDHDPKRAAAVANAYARALGNFQTNQVIQTINLQIRALSRQLASISPSDFSSRSSVVAQLAQLRAQRGATGGGAQVLQPAVPNPSPVGPHTRRAVELALVIALLLAIGAVLAAEASDRRLRTPDDLENLTGLPLLGVIPPTAFAPDSYLDPRSEESFQMLRAALTYYNLDRRLQSVAIVSPLAADGKTTVAVGLAIAAARSGQNVILVDADLRRPQVCSRLGIEPNDGLGGVLARQQPLSAMLIDLDVEASQGGTLRVLPSGPLPPNPAALIASQQMRNLLAELEGDADLVIIDTAAALAVSDSLPLLQAASGVAMIVRMNRSSAAAVRRLLKVISSAHGTVLGVVTTGSAAAAGGYGDISGYYSQRSGRGGRRRWLRLPRRRSRAPKLAVLPSDDAPAGSGARSVSDQSAPADAPSTYVSPPVLAVPVEAEPPFATDPAFPDAAEGDEVGVQNGFGPPSFEAAAEASDVPQSRLRWRRRGRS